jgi:hypothetical protein
MCVVQRTSAVFVWGIAGRIRVATSQEGMIILCGSLKFVHGEITLDLLSDHIWFLQRARQRNELKLHELDSLS